jgi:hypothetical protein
MSRWTHLPAHLALRSGPTVVKMNKYRAVKKLAADGTACDSTKEARRWDELKLRERCGDILALQAHPTFEFVVNGVMVGRFTPDSQYVLKTGEVIVEDVKSKATRTEAYMLRKRLFAALYSPLTISEY